MVKFPIAWGRGGWEEGVCHLCHFQTRTSRPPGLDPLRVLRGAEVAKGALGGRRLCPGGPGSLDQAERLEGVGGPGGPSPAPAFRGSVEEPFLDHEEQ